MIERTQITGLVLAGGLGRRMSEDGQTVDKGLQTFRGQPLISHVLARLAPQVNTVLVNANRNTDRYSTFGHPVVTDRIEGFAGPLAGLHSGMRACPTDWLASAPCDAPFLPADLVARLAHAADVAGAQVAAARTGRQAQPVFMLVRCALADHLEAFLASGARRIDAWQSTLRMAEVDFVDEQPFLNFNTREDLLGHEGGPP